MLLFVLFVFYFNKAAYCSFLTRLHIFQSWGQVPVFSPAPPLSREPVGLQSQISVTRRVMPKLGIGKHFIKDQRVNASSFPGMTGSVPTIWLYCCVNAATDCMKMNETVSQ